MTTPEEVSGSHALTTAEQLFCTLTAWHERVSIFVKGGTNIAGALWRVYAVNGSQRTLLVTGKSTGAGNEPIMLGPFNSVPGQGDTIALYGLNPFGVTPTVKAYLVGWDPSAAVTPVEASTVGTVNINLTEQDVATLTGGYVNLSATFNPNSDPLANQCQLRLYALLGGADRFLLQEKEISQAEAASGSFPWLQNYQAGAVEFILTAQGRYGTSAITAAGVLEGKTGSAGAGGGSVGTLAGDAVGPAGSNKVQSITGGFGGNIGFTEIPLGSFIGYGPFALLPTTGILRFPNSAGATTSFIATTNEGQTDNEDFLSVQSGVLTFGNKLSLNINYWNGGEETHIPWATGAGFLWQCVDLSQTFAIRTDQATHSYVHGEPDTISIKNGDIHSIFTAQSTATTANTVIATIALQDGADVVTQLDVTIVGRDDTGTHDFASYKMSYCFVKNAGAITAAASPASPVVTSVGSSAGAGVLVAPDFNISGGNVQVRMTPWTANKIGWYVSSVEHVDKRDGSA